MLNSIRPDLPECAAAIPAMTNEAERLAYYRLAREAAKHGSIIELGAWLGAATAYLAAAVRDARQEGIKAAPLFVFDRFKWDPSHVAKGAKSRDMIGQFKENLGPLMDFVRVREGEIADIAWNDLYPVSLIVFDAPKRIPEISKVLTKFAQAMRPGTILVWQDFAHFPSYDIPAAMTMLRGINCIEYIEGVYPGSTAVFRVVSPWTPQEVSEAVLDLRGWVASEIEAAWDRWAPLLPAPMRPRFQCGSALFLCDNGHVKRAEERLMEIVDAHADAVLPKWRYLQERRPDLVKRYAPLFKCLDLAAAA